MSHINVLRRYLDDNLPEFSGMFTISLNQTGNFGNTPLHVAVMRRSIDEVKTFVESGADINAIGEDGNTPLHDAVIQGCCEIVLYLLKHGSNMGIKNIFGKTPADLSKSYGCLEYFTT